MKARKYLTAAEKTSARFNVFGLRRSLLKSMSDVNSSLHVKLTPCFDCSACGCDMDDRDHVKLFEKLVSLRFKLSCIRRILPCIVADHVKRVSDPDMLTRDHVRTFLNLPCSDAIKLWSMVRVNCLQFFLERLGLHWSQNRRVVRSAVK